MKSGERVLYRSGGGELFEGIVEETGANKNFVKLSGQWRDARHITVLETLPGKAEDGSQKAEDAAEFQAAVDEGMTRLGLRLGRLETAVFRSTSHAVRQPEEHPAKPESSAAPGA